MTFKEYIKWCNERACDGCWGVVTAMACIDLIATVKRIPLWRREKYWKNEYESRVLEEIVNPINKKIANMQNGLS